MTDNVKTFPGAKRPDGPHEVNPGLVYVAEQILERVKRGEIVQLCAAGVLANGDVTTVLGPGGDYRFTMLGALEHLKARYHQRSIEFS